MENDGLTQVLIIMRTVRKTWQLYAKGLRLGRGRQSETEAEMQGRAAALCSIGDLLAGLTAR